MGSILPAKGFFVADNNVPALCTTRQKNNAVWIFYYSPIPGGREIRYSSWNPDPTAQQVGDVEIQVAGHPVVTGDFSDIACTTWSDQVQVYYVNKSTRTIEGVYFDGSAWQRSSINGAACRVSTLSPLCAIGGAGTSSTSTTNRISVMYLDKENDVLTEASSLDNRTWVKHAVKSAN